MSSGQVSMEESVAGFKLRGDWGDVVEHGERVTRALREVGLGGGDPSEDEVAAQGAVEQPSVDVERYEEAFQEWDDWRPKAHERMSEVNVKTADQASVDESQGEAAGVDPSEDMQAAGEKVAKSYEQLGEGAEDEALDSWQDSVKHAARAADTAGRKAVRAVEDTVYRRVMTQLAPYYFDNELVSANLQRTARGGDDQQFSFEININDDELKAFVANRLHEYEDVVDRWHVDTEKNTEQVAAAEGVETPPEDPDGESKSTTN